MTSYIEWVEAVFQKLADSAAARAGYDGTGILDLSELPPRSIYEDADAANAAVQAAEDLAFLVDREGGEVRLSLPGRSVVEHPSGVRAWWPDIARLSLDEEETAFLGVAIDQAEQERDELAYLELVDARDVFTALSWDVDLQRAQGLAKTLEQKGLVRTEFTSEILFRPTYAGIVRVREGDSITAHGLIQQALLEGETTNIEFKEQLDLASDGGKAKLIRHSLALATSRLSGERLLLVGFRDKTLEFVGVADSKLTRERVEQLLAAYTYPTPDVHFMRVKMGTGDAVVIEFLRDPSKLPYRVSKGIGPLQPGNVKVRHGTHSVDPDPQELGDLEAEGDAARARSI